MLDNNLENLKNELKYLKVSGRHPLYNSFMYWSKKSPEQVKLIINHLTEKGEIVFDPFVGSGVTIIESIKIKRKAMGVDINGWPLMIINSLGREVDKDVLVNDFTKLKKSISHKILNLYKTKCNHCFSKNALIKKVSFNKNNSNKNIESGNIFFWCPRCKKEYRKKLSQKDMFSMTSFENSHFSKVTLVVNSRTAVNKDKKISDLFTSRNYYACSLLYNTINKTELVYKNILKFIFGASLHLAKTTDQKAQSQFLYWLPNRDLIERNVWDLFEKKYNIFINNLKYRPKKYSNASNFNDFINNDKNVYLLMSPIQNISKTQIKDESVDLIITDPPYFDQVPYSEYMLFWKYWLNTNVNLEDEIVISNAISRNANLTKYIDLIAKSFHIISKKLKKDKFLCIYFHSTNLKQWSLIIEIIKKNGFEYQDVIYLPKKRSTYKNNSNPLRSLKGDAIIFFKKNFKKNIIKKNNINIQDIDKETKKMLENYFNKKKLILDTAEIYDNILLPYIIKNDYLSIISEHETDLISYIKSVAYYNKETGKWISKN